MSAKFYVDALMASDLPLIEEMYAAYTKDPASVDSSWHKAFERLSFEPSEKPKEFVKTSDEAISSHCGIAELILAYRCYGHLMAKVNPLSKETPKLPAQLELSQFDLHENMMQDIFPTHGLLPKPEAKLSEILTTLQSIYCESVGVEYIYGENPELEKWLQQQIEPQGFVIENIEVKKLILEHLNKSELFESFLHTKYPGQKRFSLEGGETLIPILAAIVDKGAELEVEDFIFGMAHRGRLNVLSNIMNKSYRKIFSEFQEDYIPESFEQSGDVKYHKGFFSETFTSHGHKVQINLTPNPSHLEAVDAVVEGQTYVKQLHEHGGNKQKAMPLLIHGDAAIAGQGVVYETMQLNGLEGYGTGGTVHIVINNQIGFTTVPQDGRSTHYCTDIARTFSAPVFHVNAEDPEGCIRAAFLAVEIRQRFHCDAFIDLICYRKYGHNESDEPAYTQPLEYQVIRKRKSIREIYRDHLIQKGVVERKIAEELEASFKKALQEELSEVAKIAKPKEALVIPPASEPTFQHIATGVSLARLQAIAERVCHLPDGFKIHPKLARLLKERLEMAAGAKALDWGMAETLAYGSLLWDGVHVRVSGQDVCRGTFSHRHSMLMDQERQFAYYPLKHLHENQGRFDIFNSPLSEYAVLGFEFGYSLGYPEALVLWEAQFGDFCNGAQLIIDQFISTGEQKWGQQIAVVLLLPHGYEGQGPEHSSARIERFLTLSGQNNLQVVNPSTPAQFFHLLRRQILSNIRKPLIVFTPKALLRHPECVNNINDLTLGSFQEILDDPQPPEKVDKLVVCSGHIYYDLIAERAKERNHDVAILRIEQLYPFDQQRMKELLEKYSDFKKFFWVQEEPSNMGPGEYMQLIFSKLLPKDTDYTYVARPRSASPAVGSHMVHKKQLADILAAIFGERHPSIFEIAGKKS